MNSDTPQLHITLTDTQWDLTYIDHDREIVRAIVYDDDKNLYFVRVHRDDDFGKDILIETAGGGVEPLETLENAIHRELKEELGITVDIVCKLGVISDYYNLIHRHNINHYYLCHITSFGTKAMTKKEIEAFQLTTLKLTCDEAESEYRRCSNGKLGKLIASRELPVLQRAKALLFR